MMRADDLQAQIDAIVERAKREVMAEMIESGWTPSGWQTTRLVGPLHSASTHHLFPDTNPLTVHQGSTYSAVSQRQQCKLVYATLTTAPTGGPVVIDVQRWRDGAVVVLATLYIPANQMRAASEIEDAILEAGDRLMLGVTSIGSVIPGGGLEAVVETRVDVVQGDAWGGG